MSFTRGFLLPVAALALLALVCHAAVVAGSEGDGAMAPADVGGELEAGEESDAGVDDWATKGATFGRAAKIALGNNANALLSLDLIADGGAGNQRDDGVTSGAVQGRGTRIGIELFATGVTTSLRGAIIRFNFDASLVSFVKAENSAFSLSIPEGSVGVNLASTSPVTLASSGFLARAEFVTAADVTGREFAIGIESVTLAESTTSSDVLRTSSEISFNATGSGSSDFDGDGTVGFSDFLAFAGSFGSGQGDARYEARFDLDGDGSVAFSDFLIFAGAFGSEVPPSGGGGETVTIADDNLRAVIAESLGKARTAPITRAEMTTLTRIAAPNMGIRSLSGLEHATNLRELLLGRARVDGVFVNGNVISDLSPLARLTELTYLSLTSNRISSISALSNLTSLTQLHLGGNRTISDISALSNLTMLTMLNLWDNNISDISHLSGLTNLVYLNLISNRISSITALSGLTDLTDLHLNNNSVSNINALSDLTNLTRLGFGRARVDGEWVNSNHISDLSPLSRLTALTYLDLTSNRISSIAALSNLTDLTHLHLGGNQTISVITTLSNLTMLTRLNLWENKISDISPLVANTGLGEGDIVNLRGNPLSGASLNTHVPALRRRGVEVVFDSDGGGGSGSSPDLILESLSVDDNTLTTGQSFSFSATVRNQGNASAGSTTLRYYRSADAAISTRDTEVGTDAVASLSAGRTSAESISLNAPSDAGTYYYGACVDGVSGESDTGNNCSDAVEVTVSGGGGGSGGACRAGLVVNPGETCTYKGNTFSVSSSGRGSIAFFSAGTGIDARGSTINGVRWNFHATKNSGSNSWTIHVAD